MPRGGACEPSVTANRGPGNRLVEQGGGGAIAEVERGQQPRAEQGMSRGQRGVGTGVVAVVETVRVTALK
jgi:hypothetical protein